MKKINRISIIDDDPITIFGIKKMLDHLDVCDSISTYLNGKEAIDAIKDRITDKLEVPEVIFLDINMPIMDGWQFLEEFIALPIKQKIRINIVTSSIDISDRERWEFYKSKT
ncbi:MAG: response regulator, partial [Bacteroidota bacterium]